MDFKSKKEGGIMFLVGNTTHKGLSSVVTRYSANYLDRLVRGEFKRHRMFERVLILIK